MHCFLKRMPIPKLLRPIFKTYSTVKLTNETDFQIRAGPFCSRDDIGQLDLNGNIYYNSGIKFHSILYSILYSLQDAYIVTAGGT